MKIITTEQPIGLLLGLCLNICIDRKFSGKDAPVESNRISCKTSGVLITLWGIW